MRSSYPIGRQTRVRESYIGRPHVSNKLFRFSTLVPRVGRFSGALQDNDLLPCSCRFQVCGVTFHYSRFSPNCQIPRSHWPAASYYRAIYVPRSCEAMSQGRRNTQRRSFNSTGRLWANPRLLAITHYERAPRGVGCECEAHRLRKEHPSD